MANRHRNKRHSVRLIYIIPIYIIPVAHPVLQNNTSDFGGAGGAKCVVALSATICWCSTGSTTVTHPGEFEMSFSLNISVDIAPNDIILISMCSE